MKVYAKEDIKDLSLEELKARLDKFGYEPYRAEQIFEWIYKNGAMNFGSMTDLPLKLRDRLTEKFLILSSKIVDTRTSKIDATRKYLIRSEDTQTIEAVFIPVDGRATICLSSQVGCAFGCKFCASGLLGFKRNLRCGEILDQVLLISNDVKTRRITNIVIMGMGEPLLNYDNVMKALSIINSPWGLGIGARKITVSTAGYIPGIKRFMQEKSQVELSVSLHAANNKTRSALMPINDKYPLPELMKVCREYTGEKGRIITFEYVLIKGINASREDATALAKLLAGLNCKVNLIPFNAVANLDFAAPSDNEVKAFHGILKAKGISSTIRKERGADINAACGQLKIAGNGR